MPKDEIGVNFQGAESIPTVSGAWSPMVDSRAKSLTCIN
jgi:hypothetical protein